MRSIYEIGFIWVVVMHRPPKRCEALLAVQQMLGYARRRDGVRSPHVSRDELFLVANLQYQRDANWQVLNDRVQKAGDSTSIPSFEALKPRQFCRTAFDLL